MRVLSASVLVGVALRRGIVVMEAVVLAGGSVGDVQVVRSLDKEYGLGAQAVLAVRQWRFEPGRVGGRVEPMIVTVEMSFTLK